MESSYKQSKERFQFLDGAIKSQDGKQKIRVFDMFQFLDGAIKRAHVQ